jgi:phage shock protein PspC (stress-responsive transcriptional regulator)
MNGRLYRSRDERMLAGVAGGIADWLDIDPAIVRLGWVIAVVLTQGLAVLVYIAMVFVIPEEPWAPSTPFGSVPAPGGGAAPPATGAPAPGTGPADHPASAPSTPATTPIPAWQPGADDWREARRQEREARRAARREGRGARGEDGPGRGVVVLGVLLVAAGVYFLVRDYLPPIRWDVLWPAALVLLGIVLIVRALDLGGRGSPPASPSP